MHHEGLVRLSLTSRAWCVPTEMYPTQSCKHLQRPDTHWSLASSLLPATQQMANYPPPQGSAVWDRHTGKSALGLSRMHHWRSVTHIPCLLMQRGRLPG